eukprot:356293-Chlamydomonas_euryale.AAC.7
MPSRGSTPGPAGPYCRMTRAGGSRQHRAVPLLGPVRSPSSRHSPRNFEPEDPRASGNQKSNQPYAWDWQVAQQAKRLAKERDSPCGGSCPRQR